MDMTEGRAVSGDTVMPSPSRTRAVIASTAGHVIEWFDFSIYAYFAAYIGKAFFPSTSPYTSLLSTLAVFGVGFAARPLGSIVFGHYGDRIGRRNVLAVAILLMAGCSLVIGLLPSYETIGTAGAVILVVARLLQGFSTGGEYTGAGLFVVEHAPPDRRGFFGSLHQAGIGIGLFLGSMSATLVTTLLAADQVASYGWRLPFLIGGVFGLLGLFMRLSIAESPQFARMKASAPVASVPLAEALRTEFGKMAIVGGIFVSATVNFYAFLAYLPTYATVVLGIDGKDALLANTIGLLVFTVTSLIAGRLSDRFGRKSMLILHAGGLLLLTWPMFSYLEAHRSFAVLLAVQCVGAALQGAFSGAGLVTALELVPTRFRYSAVAVPQSVVTSLFGGSAPFIVTAIVATTGSPLAIVYYLIPATAISLLTYLVMRETAQAVME